MIGDSRPMSVKVEADSGTLISHQAVSIGLIVTELVMNALRHAFPREKKGVAILVSYKVSDADWRLTISDNGGGMPDLSASQKKGGPGTSLIQSLAKQLEAGVETASDFHRTAITVTHAQANPNHSRRHRLCALQTRSQRLFWFS
jgi:chemotaxis protein methyltransferase CheR